MDCDPPGLVIGAEKESSAPEPTPPPSAVSPVQQLGSQEGDDAAAQDSGDEPRGGVPSDSVPDTVIQNVSLTGSEADSLPYAAQDHAGNVENTGSMAPAALAAGADAAATDERAGSDGGPARKRTRAQARAEQATAERSAEGAGTHVPGEAAQVDNLEGSQGEDSQAEAALQSSEAASPSCSHEDRADVSSERAQTVNRDAGAKVAVGEEGAGPARRTRSRASLSSVPDLDLLKFPDACKGPRVQRSRRARAEKTDSVVSAGPSSSGGVRALRPRTRAGCANSAATTSTDTGNASDAENRAADADNVGTSALQEVEEAGDVGDAEPPAFVATLSPIPENKPIKNKGEICLSYTTIFGLSPLSYQALTQPDCMQESKLQSETGMRRVLLARGLKRCPEELHVE